MNVIETRGLCKSYGSTPALAGIDLRVPQGSIFGFLGPNGAGKTTAMRILVGLLRSTAGEARVLDRDAWRDSTAIRRELGYLPGDVRLYEWMRGDAFLAFCERARATSCAAEKRRLCERFELNTSRRIRDYSRGMKQKLALIAALMHRPLVLILDEPTTGLDPLMQQALYAELRATAAEGRTILLSSHTLSEVELLCDRVAIIRAGRIVEDSTIDALRARAVKRVELRMTTDDLRNVEFPAEWTPISSEDGKVTGAWRGPVLRLLSWLASLKPRDVTISPPDLEDLFAAYYLPE
jgi:ABC-2 type transport system ATP-binding protein